MGDFRVRRLQPGAGQTKIRNVPIAVTPEGFWCCPSPAVLQKTLKNQNHQTKHRGSSLPTSKALSVEKSPNIALEKRTSSTPTRSRPVSDEQKCPSADNPPLSPTTASERPPKPTAESQQHKISVGFGQPETSDLKVILYGKEGLAVKMSVHSNILAENSSYFSDRLSRQSPVPCLEILDCEDVEIYVETVGLMYCKEVKHRLIKQTVPRVLRILKVAESLGFRACVISCLDYLEAVPWVGEEEESVLSSIRHLRNDNYGVSPLLKRVCSDITNLPNDTLSHIMELVLKSSEDRGRREMKSLVLKLLKENNIWTNGSADICIETLYSSCRSCLDSLLALFRQASAADFADTSLESKDLVMRQITLDADNLLWLVEILADRRIADDFAVIWANQNELAGLHSKIPIVSRHLVSGVSARLFVGIGRGEILPLKDTRQLLLHVWLQPLIDDYSWLQHCCRSFDRKVAEEGIGQTILTLPLEDQQNILLSWLGSFLKVGDNCPNLQRAFEVWWRRTFIRPYAEKQGHTLQSETSDRS